MSNFGKESMEKRKYKKRNVWRQHGEELLLELWADRAKELRNGRKNGQTYLEIASILKKNNVFVSSDEVKVKIHNLSSKYRRMRLSGDSPSDWQYFQRVHQILGDLTISKVESLVDDSFMCENYEITEVVSLNPEPSPSPVLEPPPQPSPMLIASLLKRMENYERRIEKQQEEINNVAKETAARNNRATNLLEELVKSTVAANNAYIEYLKKH